MTMQALVLEQLHQPLLLKEVTVPVLQENEVLIQLKAAALNRRDFWIQQGQYAAIRLPAILGSDGAGIVADIGVTVDAAWRDKEVVINPGLHWGKNPKAQSREFRVLGMPDSGTFAQYVKVPVTHLVPKPAHLTWQQAAALPLAGLTAYRSLFTRAELQPYEKILVTGVGGGVALQCMQFAVATGADVYVTSGSDDKLQQAIEMGAKGGANYKQVDWVASLKSQAGAFDVIIDSAAGDSVAKLTELAAEGGRIVFYGGTNGVINGIVPGRIFWKQLSILGSTMGTEGEFNTMVEFVEKHKLAPVVSKIFAFAEVNEALQYMQEAAQFGKIVLEIE
ncbi:zinc-binding dehydrogenase [Xanthocytophaga flavus]|nr:zinc-binding dehydrogenase [Xanthocytophaga flavus]